jgi:hypothetical protein
LVAESRAIEQEAIATVGFQDVLIGLGKVYRTDPDAPIRKELGRHLDPALDFCQLHEVKWPGALGAPLKPRQVSGARLSADMPQSDAHGSSVCGCSGCGEQQRGDVERDHARLSLGSAGALGIY